MRKYTTFSKYRGTAAACLATLLVAGIVFHWGTMFGNSSLPYLDRNVMVVTHVEFVTPMPNMCHYTIGAQDDSNAAPAPADYKAPEGKFVIHAACGLYAAGEQLLLSKSIRR